MTLSRVTGVDCCGGVQNPALAQDDASTHMSESATRLLLVLEAGEVDAFEWDFRRERMQCVGALSREHGLPLDESIAEYLDRIHPEDREDHSLILARLTADALRYAAEYRVRGASGTYLHVVDSGLASFDEAGLMLNLLGTRRRLGEVRRSQPSTPSCEGRYHSLLQALPSMTFESDAEGGNIFASEQWCAYTGLTPDQTAGSGWTQAVHPEDLPGVAARWALAVRLGEACEMRHRIRAADGSYRWFLLRSRALRDHHGRIERWAGSLTDVEDLLRTQQALRASEDRFQLSAEIGRFGTWDWDMSSGEVDWSRGHYEILGYDIGAVTPSFAAWADRVHPQDRSSFEEAMRRSMSERRDYASEFRVVWPDGSIHWVSARARYEYGAEGICHRMVGVMGDVTELEQAVRKLRELNERLIALLAERTRLAEAQAAHLRALVRELTRTEQRERDRLYELLHDHVQPLLVGARLTLSGLDQRTPIKTWIRIAADASSQIAEALDTARSLSVELNPPLVREQGLGPALEWLRRWVEGRHGLRVDLKWEAAAEPPDTATRLVLFKAVRELLMNVAKHAGVSQVMLRIERVAGNMVCVTVADRGVGFDMAEFRAERTHRTGSGLWNMERRLCMIGGQVDIDSTPGEGTSVSLLAPLLVSAAAVVAAAVRPPADGDGA